MEGENYSQRELPVQKLRDANSSNCIRNSKEAQWLEIDELGETREEPLSSGLGGTLKDFGFSLSDMGSTGQSLTVLGKGMDGSS